MNDDVRITLRMPREVHRAMATAALRNHRSMNNQIVATLDAAIKTAARNEKAPGVATAQGFDANPL